MVLQWINGILKYWLRKGFLGGYQRLTSSTDNELRRVLNSSISLASFSPLSISFESKKSMIGPGSSVNSAKRENISTRSSSGIFHVLAYSIGVTGLPSHTAFGSTLAYHKIGKFKKRKIYPNSSRILAKSLFRERMEFCKSVPFSWTFAVLTWQEQKLKIYLKINSHQIHWQRFEYTLKLFYSITFPTVNDNWHPEEFHFVSDLCEFCEDCQNFLESTSYCNLHRSVLQVCWPVLLGITNGSWINPEEGRLSSSKKLIHHECCYSRSWQTRSPARYEWSHACPYIRHLAVKFHNHAHHWCSPGLGPDFKNIVSLLSPTREATSWVIFENLPLPPCW